MTDNTARQKVPLPNGYVVPRPQQPPPLRRKDTPTTGMDVADVPAPAASGPAPMVQPKIAMDDQRAKTAAFREAMATLSDDEDKTTAFQVPEELLRRSRIGMPGPAFEEENGPDSGAVTAPPPASPEALSTAEVSGVKFGVPGVPKDLDVQSFSDVGLESEAAEPNIESDEDDEHSGEFTRINKSGELEALAPNMDRQEPTRTVVRKRVERAKRNTAVAALWLVIGVLSAAGAILATMMVNG